jgi:geranylgeranyl pyrophosphate synthase|mmetsp:Transcript_31614/g.71418  ORF Transcript_31614/g.71418 Transcript_31614/m.71418 type:complete len:149 (+) Transcript_31614:1027-1473(+)
MLHHARHLVQQPPAVFAPADTRAQSISAVFHSFLALSYVARAQDFTASTNDLGKPALADMAQGLATAPTLFALEEFPELDRLILRGFSEHGDAAIACDYISRSRGVSRTQELAASHTQQAANAIGVLRPSEARDGLLRLCSDVLNRRA